MNRLTIFVFLWSLTLSILKGNAQNTPPTIVATGEQLYCSDVPMVIATDLSINDADDTELDEVFIQISEGYAAGFDLLTLTGNHPNISSSWDAAQGKLILNGPALISEFEAAILSIEFTTTQTFFTSDRSFSINLADANFLPTTGHYYIYESSPGITWTAARNAASQQTFFGLQGYLATITTLEEAVLTGEQSPGTGWIGASDAATEGEWLWVTGPEAGTQFWQGMSTGTPVNGEFSFWNIGEPNQFGDEDYAHITDTSVGEPGSWNDLDVTGDLDPSNPYHPQGYLVEFGGMPGEPQINLSAATSIKMPQTIYENEFACAGQELTLTLETNTDTVLWYETETSNTVINSGNEYTTTINQTTTFWIDARLSGCTIENRRPLVVSVNPLPSFNDISIQQCDDMDDDGISTFRLFNFELEIADGVSTNREVTFFEDIDLTQPINGLNYDNQFSGQVVYAKVRNTSTGCFQTAEITLTVSSNNGNSYSIQKCDDTTEDGLTSFDLSTLNSDILSGFPVSYSVDYFSSFDEALRDQNELPGLYTNTTPYSQIIYVRLSEGNTCLGIYPVSLTVERLPNLSPNETRFYCINRPTDTLTLSSGLLDDNLSNYTFEWSTGETSESIIVNDIGSYSVEVAEIGGCSKERIITVEPSNIATIDDVEVIDFAANNIVTVVVSGEGTYDFALDNINGPYQDSNSFQNVAPGLYTLFVRDIKGDCGIVNDFISVLGYPRFFTPNGDEINDTWEIKGFSTEFPVTTEVKIFNRYGKLLAVLDRNNPRWDGILNGQKLPTDDYWFVVDFQDGRTYRGHFTLKR